MTLMGRRERMSRRCRTSAGCLARPSASPSSCLPDLLPCGWSAGHQSLPLSNSIRFLILTLIPSMSSKTCIFFNMLILLFLDTCYLFIFSCVCVCGLIGLINRSVFRSYESLVLRSAGGVRRGGRIVRHCRSKWCVCLYSNSV